jgi:hypothetical protein
LVQTIVISLKTQTHVENDCRNSDLNKTRPAPISPTFNLSAAFSYESLFSGFLYLQFGFEIFCTKAACKMLVKLTTGY